MSRRNQDHWDTYIVDFKVLSIRSGLWQNQLSFPVPYNWEWSSNKWNEWQLSSHFSAAFSRETLGAGAHYCTKHLAAPVPAARPALLSRIMCCAGPGTSFRIGSRNNDKDKTRRENPKIPVQSSIHGMWQEHDPKDPPSEVSCPCSDRSELPSVAWEGRTRSQADGCNVAQREAISFFSPDRTTNYLHSCSGICEPMVHIVGLFLFLEFWCD